MALFERLALSEEQQRWLEQQLGGPVEIVLYAGTIAHGLCRILGAAAFTFRSAVWCDRPTSVNLIRWEDRARVLLVHEATHVLQFGRHGTVRFLWQYGYEYLRGRLRGERHGVAYRAISAEREAFAAQAEAWDRLCRE